MFYEGKKLTPEESEKKIFKLSPQREALAQK